MTIDPSLPAEKSLTPNAELAHSTWLTDPSCNSWYAISVHALFPLFWNTATFRLKLPNANTSPQLGSAQQIFQIAASSLYNPSFTLWTDRHILAYHCCGGGYRQCHRNQPRPVASHCGCTGSRSRLIGRYYWWFWGDGDWDCYWDFGFTFYTHDILPKLL